MQSRPPRWELRPAIEPDLTHRLQAALPHLNLSTLLLQLLSNRELVEPDHIESFLIPPDLATYPDPLLMEGMPQAVDRIERAIKRGERIVVYGDFDADGVTATALLTGALRRFGGIAEPYVPNRMLEGYGLNAGAVRAIAASGAHLLITVDCGISGRAEIAEARKLGLDVIVTDHHQLPSDLPEAVALINPKQYVEGCECYQHLAGVGVAYQLVRALVKRIGKPPGLRNLDLLGLVAIGTVADVAHLKGANRSLVRQGVAALKTSAMPGIRTMLEFAHLKLDAVDTERIGFVIGPRLNAAGRIDDTRTAYNLLMTSDAREARELAQKLEAQNRRRQALMDVIVEQAKARARELDDSLKIIVLSDPQWHSGVIGPVANRLVEEFGRPALIIEEGEEESRGSARSTPHFNMVEALNEVKDLLVRHGGHAAAAGFTIKTSNIGEFARRLACVAEARVSDEQMQPVVYADAEIAMSDVSDATLADISRLSPFGSGNNLPLFMARDLRVLDIFPVGAAHLKLILADRTNISGLGVEAISFRSSHLAEAIKRHRRVDLLFHIERREWKGDTHLQLRAKDIRLSDA